MPALNFCARFAEAVEYGEKLQTVRAVRKDGRPHCKKGDRIRLYTGMRTKQCRLLGEATVTHTARIRIEATEMFINDRRLPSAIYARNCAETDNEFAEADGFESFMDMSRWFEEAHRLPFVGTVIYWDAPR